MACLLAATAAFGVRASAANGPAVNPGDEAKARDWIGESSPAAVIGKVGDQPISTADVISQNQAAFDKLQADFEFKRQQLERSNAQSRYELVRQQLDRLLDDRALQLEAAARGASKESVLAEITVPAVTEDAVRAYYEANRARTTKSLDELRPEITQYLANQYNTNATRAFYDSLRARHRVTESLPPFRLPVAATGPSLGKESAPVTIVEFGDFQCPYCRQVEDTLRAVLANHPDDVRLVFRELPLASIHPNAMGAAEAAVCADRQTMFWQMHDAMYQDQSALTMGALKDTARRLGLDTEAFTACMSDERTRDVIAADTHAADGINVTGTPYFLINGRPLYGSVPADQFESIITDELHRIAGKHG
jgi:protein-disulfide isomerase/Spy/CpxP family protein refolding chaperone